MKQALIIVDMLNDFVTGKLGGKRALAVVKPIKELLQRFRQKHLPVIYVNDAHTKTDSELKLWGQHAIKNTAGAKIIPPLVSLSNEYIISKKHYSGFFNTNLHDLLQKLKIDTIVVVGVYINLCVFHTVADAYQWGYKVVVPQDATNSFKASDYRVFLQYFAQNYAVEVTTTAKVIKGI